MKHNGSSTLREAAKRINALAETQNLLARYAAVTGRDSNEALIEAGRMSRKMRISLNFAIELLITRAAVGK